MAECTPSAIVRRSTAHASLAALGVKLHQLDLLSPLREEVKIAQKAVKYTPFEKLYDCFIGILAGAHGIVEINERLRADPALDRKSTRLNSSHTVISYAVFCLK